MKILPEDHKSCCGFVEILEGPVVDGDRVHLQEGACRLGHQAKNVCHDSALFQTLHDSNVILVHLNKNL